MKSEDQIVAILRNLPATLLLITHSRAPIPIGDAAPANVILESAGSVGGPTGLRFPRGLRTATSG